MELELEANESRLLKNIAKEGANSQKELSMKSGLSVGMINILIKKLVNKGYVKLSRLNKRNFQYLLTKKGFIEQVRLTNLYVQDTFTMVNNYRFWSKELVEQLIEKGFNDFILVGKGDLSVIVEEILKSIEDLRFVKVMSIDNVSSTNMYILDCQNISISNDDIFNSNNYTNVLEYLHIKINSLDSKNV